ncbi:MAG: S8 family serine peptidase, partial [Acidobacteria bacterium]|nr:S8 family serine peptidase [Acidobacteriota bacterium]
MAKTKAPGRRKKTTGQSTRSLDALPSAPPPDQLTPPQEQTRRAAVTGQAQATRDDERLRRDDLRTNMLRSVLTEPLLSKVQNNRSESFDVIISLNEFYKGGIDAALKIVAARADDWKVPFAVVSNYVFACLSGARLLQLADETHQQLETAIEGGENVRGAAVIYRIWEDNDVHLSLTRSLTTVKADAAQRAFQAHGTGIVWAVLDSGVQGDHPHFKRDSSPFGRIDTLDVRDPVRHWDFTPDGRSAGADDPGFPLRDSFGHGTHVAGIIAGYWKAQSPDGEPVVGAEMRNENNRDEPLRRRETLIEISGVAPKCSVVSLKVIADRGSDGAVKQTAGQGKVSWLLLAIDRIQQWNQNGKRLHVHGVNMSLGYEFDPRWFACGESPLCVEVNRLVKSGVVVVVSAGNGGYAAFLTGNDTAVSRYSEMSITDPGNADLAITVGSTHKEMPHRYGVSYFSSRGPTGDGRAKPDLLAPGERIVSCAAGQERQKYEGVPTDGPAAGPVLYCEQSGT